MQSSNNEMAPIVNNQLSKKRKHKPDNATREENDAYLEKRGDGPIKRAKYTAIFPSAEDNGVMNEEEEEEEEKEFVQMAATQDNGDDDDNDDEGDGDEDLEEEEEEI